MFNCKTESVKSATRAQAGEKTTPEFTSKEYLFGIFNYVAHIQEHLGSIELLIEDLPTEQTLSEAMEQLSSDHSEHLEAIEALTEDTNNLTEVIKEVNVIRVYGDGDDGVKIWSKGEVNLINPIVTELPHKRRIKQPQETSADKIKRRFDERRKK